MAYVATRGGEYAIDQAERLFRGDLGTISRERVKADKNAAAAKPVDVETLPSQQEEVAL